MRAVAEDDVLVAAPSPGEVVAWLAQHGQRGQSMFRVPDSDQAILLTDLSFSSTPRGRMLRAMTVDVTVKTIEPTPTAVVVAATTWVEFPKMWGPMLDKVWGYLRDGAPEGLYTQGHNIMLYKDDVPNVEVGVQVSGSFDPVGHVVASTLPGGLVATATHTGPIAEIGGTHHAVCEWSKANGYRLAGPRWEIYGDPNPSTGHFDVDVFWSLVAP